MKYPNTQKLCDIFNNCLCKNCPILIECKRPYGLGKEEKIKHQIAKENKAKMYLEGIR